MFTWICPKCGRECPPAYTECPDCAGRQDEAPARDAAPAPKAAQAAAAPTAAKPRPTPSPARSGGMPTWLLSVVFALAFFGIGAGVYMLVQHSRGREPQKAPAAAAPGALEVPKPVAAAPATLQRHPYLKYVEITGWRLLQNAQKRAEIRFVVVNHSAAEIPDLSATVNLRAQAGQESSPIGSFSFKLPSLGPYESRDLTAPLDTKLKVYEFPDWQNLFEEIQVDSPPK